MPRIAQGTCAQGPCERWLMRQGRYEKARDSLATVLVCFAALCLVAIAFVFKFLPETKGLSLEEVVREFEREACGGSRSGDAQTLR